MSTFKEFQQRLMAAKFKTVVYQHLVDYLEGEFRPVSGGKPKKVLLTDDKLPVPDETIDGVVKELFGGLTNLSQEMDQILTATIQPAVVPPAAVQAPPTAPAAPPATPEQGEVQS